MNSVIKKLTFLILIILFVAPVQQLEAHAPDQGYLYMRIYGDAMGGRFELAAEDINRAIGTNLDDDLTLEIITPHLEKLYAYIKDRSSFQSDLGQYSIRFTEPTLLKLEEKNDFLRFNFELDGVSKVPESLDIGYNLIFDKHDIHRGMLLVEYNWKAGIVDNEALLSNVFTPSATKTTLSLTDASIWKGFVALVKLGIWHIWIGLDHILFLVALILPAVVRREENTTGIGAWKPVEKFKPAFLYIIKIITFFTIAHSITLALAALGYINLSSRLVESIIAISIALAAFHNIKPIFKHKEWIIAFAFGLFHGFGFASVLGEKGLSGDFMTLSLLGFNIGVELGQLLIICMIFPVLYFIRKLPIYPSIIKLGSILLIFISIYWFIERWFEVDLTLGTYFWQMYNGVFG